MAARRGDLDRHGVRGRVVAAHPLLSDAAVDRHRSILDSLSLPTTYPAGRWKTLLATMKRDKKARGELLRFVVLDDIGRPTMLTGPEEQLLFAAYQEIAD